MFLCSWPVDDRFLDKKHTLESYYSEFLSYADKLLDKLRSVTDELIKLENIETTLEKEYSVKFRDVLQDIRNSRALPIEARLGRSKLTPANAARLFF